MDNVVIKVEGMSCSHCENAVKKAAGGLAGVSAVSVDLNGKTVTVSYEASKITLDEIKYVIEEQGYEVIK